MNPEQLKDILSKNYIFRKTEPNPLGKLLATGLASYDAEKWAKHRRIINPAFHLEKLKVISFIFSFVLRHLNSTIY